MKKHNLLLALFAFLMFAVSCGEDEDETLSVDEQEEVQEEEEENETPGDEICQISEIIYAPGERMAFGYNADGDMLTLTSYSDNVEDDKITFSYSNGRLVKGTSDSGGSVDVEYASDKISKFIYQFEGESEIDEYRFSYTGEVISKIENWDNYSGNVPGEFTLYATENFTYSGDNITQYSSAEIEGETFEAVIAYDDKKNPFQNSLGYFIWELDISAFYSANNPVSFEITYSDDTSTEEYTQTVAYTYNEDDYPTLRTYTDEEGDTYSEQMSYDCN
ncbi:MAG: hypothetical protein RIA69_01365 [Cyclobacteriaceae bacterium]